MDSDFWALGFLALLIAGRFALDRIDRSMIRSALRSAGVTPLKINWSPFGYGAGDDGRTYEVWYRSFDGVTVSVYCQTSLTGGLFWGGGIPPSILAKRAAEKRRSEADQSKSTPSEPPSRAPW